jgi:geranylgeranyl transferase type-2 subunit alpha
MADPPIETTVSLMGPQLAFVQSRLPQEITNNPKTPATVDSTNNSIITIPQTLIQSEFDFTTTKIKDNFSNFSAFHYRSQLLDFLISGTSSSSTTTTTMSMEDRLRDEFQLIEDAICTEPDDQTSWWYHAILLDKIVGKKENDDCNCNDDDDNNNNNAICIALRPRLEEQADLFRELLEDSPGKWVILGLFRVLQILAATCNSHEDRETSIKEQESLLRQLMEIDPDRSQVFADLLSVSKQ